jgi:hypothetical protein
MSTGSSDKDQLRNKGQQFYGIGSAGTRADTTSFGAHSDVERMTESSIYPSLEFVWKTARERSTFRFFTWLERVRCLCVYDC